MENKIPVYADGKLIGYINANADASHLTIKPVGDVEGPIVSPQSLTGEFVIEFPGRIEDAILDAEYLV